MHCHVQRKSQRAVRIFKFPSNSDTTSGQVHCAGQKTKEMRSETASTGKQDTHPPHQWTSGHPDKARSDSPHTGKLGNTSTHSGQTGPRFHVMDFLPAVPV